jgi:hypothetical protein
MATTDPPTRRDVVTRVCRQHDTIRRLFDEVEKAPPARRAEAFQPLVRLLAVHETAEEMVVYPLCFSPGATLAPSSGPVRPRRTRRRRISPRWRVATPAPGSSWYDFVGYREAVEAHAAGTALRHRREPSRPVDPHLTRPLSPSTIVDDSDTDFVTVDLEPS